MKSWIKAKFFLLLIGLVWGSLIILALPLLIIAYIVDRYLPVVDWVRTILLGQDLYTHAIMGGNHRTYISSLLGHMQTTGSKTGTAVAMFVDLLFKVLTGERNHCKNAMKPTDNYIFSARRAIAGTLLHFAGLFIQFNLISLVL